MVMIPPSLMLTGVVMATDMHTHTHANAHGHTGHR